MARALSKDRIAGSKTDREHFSFGPDALGKPARRVISTDSDALLAALERLETLLTEQNEYLDIIVSRIAK